MLWFRLYFKYYEHFGRKRLKFTISYNRFVNKSKGIKLDAFFVRWYDFCLRFKLNHNPVEANKPPSLVTRWFNYKS